MEKEEFVDKLFIALQRLSSGAQKRVLEDMRRLNSSILCKKSIRLLVERFEN